ncbi:pentatricopeptide repeat-containing protein [Sesbania bispinosa]|nr:pentatricopeptide repeat-containing protein [Sesbania bispinosa]
MGVIGFEINGNSALHYGGNSFSSYAIPISSRPFFGNVLNTRVIRKFQVSHARKLNFGPVMVSLNGGSNAGLVSDGLLPKELEFKPSFDQYLKAMESARTVRGKKHGAATTQKQKRMGKGGEGNKIKNFKRVGEKIDRKDGLVAAKEDVVLKVDETFMYKEGSYGKVRGKPVKGFKNEYDGKESKLDVKTKQKHGANIGQDGWLKRQSHSLEPESDDCSMIRSQGKSGSGRISYKIVRSNLNGSRESVKERGVTHDLYSSKMSGDSRQRDRIRNTQGETPGADKIVANKKVMDRGLVRRHTEIESLMNRNGQANVKVKLNGSRKPFLDRGYDSDNLEVERAAFKNLKDSNNVIGKPQFSHKEMEERIEKLAKSYVVHSFHAFGIPKMDKITCSGP